MKTYILKDENLTLQELRIKLIQETRALYKHVEDYDSLEKDDLNEDLGYKEWLNWFDEQQGKIEALRVVLAKLNLQPDTIRK